MTQEQINAVRSVANLFVDAVRAAGPLGAPGGHLYAATMGSLTLSQFEAIMGGLVRAGRLTKRDECYFIA
jgi:hypothetical protein